MKRGLVITNAAIAMVLGAQFASAQIAPPIEDGVIQGEIINRAVGDALNPGAARGDAKDNEIDGEAGIYILTVNKIFQISGFGDIGYTSNPTRTSTDNGGAWYSDLGASIGVATRLAGAVDFNASLNVDAREFLGDDDGGPSSRSVSTTVAAGAPVFGPVYGNLIAFGGYSFEDKFDESTGFYGLSGNLSVPFQLADSLLVRPGVGVTQQWSDVSENNSLTATASVDAVYAFTPQLLLSARASISDRNYEDFYEDVTFVERDDTVRGISVALIYRPSRDLVFTVGASYEEQDSTFFLSEFEAFDSSLNISLRRTF